MRKESIEEMEHADKLVERIIFLDGFPNMQVLDPLHIGQNVKEVLDCDLAAEISARTLYEEAATHCHAVRDYVSRDLFEKLSSIWSPSLGSNSMLSTISASLKRTRTKRPQPQISNKQNASLGHAQIVRKVQAACATAVPPISGLAGGSDYSFTVRLDALLPFPYFRRRDTPPHRGATIWKDRP